jgi:hypothetical protein
VKGKQDEAKHCPGPASIPEHGGGPGQEGVFLSPDRHCPFRSSIFLTSFGWSATETT